MGRREKRGRKNRLAQQNETKKTLGRFTEKGFGEARKVFE